MKKTRAKRPAKETGKKDAKKHRQTIIILVAVIILVTFIGYKDTFRGEFTNWDDNQYITENIKLRQLNADRVKEIFTGYQMSNYHPFVMLTYNILYFLFKTDTFPYHLFNTIVHLINCILVFFFIYVLTERKIIPAFVVSLLFGIHPLHVESVAWISETKDILYTMFFVAGLIGYLRYRRDSARKYYGLTIVLFVFSCLSKGMAVTFPLVLLLIDFYQTRGFSLTRREWLEKIPFFMIALVFGIIAVMAQKSGDALGEVTTKLFHHNLLIASHGLWFYIYKMIWPVHLSAFYPYPIIKDGWLPLKFYLSPLAAVAIIVAVIYFGRKHRYILFGFLFFLVNVIQVLQILPVGSAIAADRYFYVSSIGLFFILGIWANELYKKYSTVFIIASLVLGVALTTVTHERAKIWQNSLNLWQSVLKEYPNYPGAAVAYNNCGMIYRRMGDFDQAFWYVRRALELDGKYGLAHKNMGGLYGKIQDYENAEKHLLEAQKYSPEDAGVYNNLGILYALTGRPDQALRQFQQALSINPEDADAYINMGNYYLEVGEIRQAIRYYEKAIQIDREQPAPYYQLAVIYLNSGDQAKARAYFIAAAQRGHDPAQKWLRERRIGY